jgi:hypothetical protein
MVSPFIMLFWAGVVALVATILSIKLSRLRLMMMAGFYAIMLLAFITQGLLGLPLERLWGNFIGSAQANDPMAEFTVGVIRVHKTTWYWVALSAVLLFGLTEAIISLWRKGVEPRTPILVPAALWIGFGLVALSGIAVQYRLRELSLRDKESRIAELQEVENGIKTDAEHKKQMEIDAQEKAKRDGGKGN